MWQIRRTSRQAAVGKDGMFFQTLKAIAGDAGSPYVDATAHICSASDIRSVAELSARIDKPTAILWTGRCTDDDGPTPAELVAAGHAVYRDALPCMKAIRRNIEYAEMREAPSTEFAAMSPRYRQQQGKIAT